MAESLWPEGCSPGVGDPLDWAIHQTKDDPTFRFEVRVYYAGIAKFCYEWDALAFVAADHILLLAPAPSGPSNAIEELLELHPGLLDLEA